MRFVDATLIILIAVFDMSNAQAQIVPDSIQDKPVDVAFENPLKVTHYLNASNPEGFPAGMYHSDFIFATGWVSKGNALGNYVIRFSPGHDHQEIDGPTNSACIDNSNWDCLSLALIIEGAKEFSSSGEQWWGADKPDIDLSYTIKIAGTGAKIIKPGIYTAYVDAALWTD